MTVEIVIALALAIAIWPLSILSRRFPGHWRRTVYGSLGIFFLAFAFVEPEYRIVSLILACVACAAAFKPTGKPA
jgi:hypothetical protein